MAELADALDLESSVSRREGSSPFTRTSMDVFIGFHSSIKTGVNVKIDCEIKFVNLLT